jgi:TRAP-type C4-dicarboxylate transport system substrate-binding protein
MKKNQKKDILFGLVFLAVTISMMAAPLPSVAAGSEPIVWRFDIQDPPTHWSTARVFVPYANEVNAKTAPEFKIVPYPSSGTGLKPSAQLRGLKNNMIDMSEINSGWNTGDEPLLSIVSLPCLYRSPQQVKVAIKGVEDLLIKRLEEKWDMKILWVGPLDEQILYSVKPIKGLDDFKGKKVRTYQRWLEMWVNAFGGRSVNVPYPEQYSAYERGVMDAGITGSGTGVAMKFDEVVSSAYAGLGLDFIPKIVAVSGKSWRALPKKYQTVLLEFAPKYEAHMTQVSAEVSEENYKIFEDHGMTVLRATDKEVELAQKIARENVWPVFIKEQGDIAQELVDRVHKAVK